MKVTRLLCFLSALAILVWMGLGFPTGAVRADVVCDPYDCPVGTNSGYLWWNCDDCFTGCCDVGPWTATNYCRYWDHTPPELDQCHLGTPSIGDIGVNIYGCAGYETSENPNCDIGDHYVEIPCCPQDLGEDPDDEVCELQSDSLTTCASTGFVSATRGLLAQVFKIAGGNWFGDPQNKPPNTELPITGGIEYPKGLIGPNECWGVWGGVRWEGYVNFKLAGTYTFKSDLGHDDINVPYGFAVYIDDPLTQLYTMSSENWCDTDSDGEEDELCTSSQGNVVITTPGWKKFRVDIWTGGLWGVLDFDTEIRYNMGLAGDSGWKKITTAVNNWFEISPCAQAVPAVPVTIQGFKVSGCSSSTIDPNISGINVCLDMPAVCTANQPYFLNYTTVTNPVAGNTDRQVTVPAPPVGYSLTGSTMCYNSTTCHGGTPTPGASRGISDWSAINNDPDPAAAKYVDLWWHYCPIQAAPTGVTAAPVCNGLSINWLAAAGATHYRVVVDGTGYIKAAYGMAGEKSGRLTCLLGEGKKDRGMPA